MWQSVLQDKFQQLRRGTQVFFVFLLVSLTWVFFAVPGFKNATAVLQRIFSWDLLSSFSTISAIFMRPDYLTYISLVLIFFTVDSLGVIDNVVERVPEGRIEIARELVVINSLVVLMLLIGDIGSRSFIYLQF